VTDRVKVGAGPGWTAYDEHSVWVGNATDGTVSRIDAGTRHVTATIKVGPNPLDGDVLGDSVWVPLKDGRLVRIGRTGQSNDDVIAHGNSASLNPFVICGYDGSIWAVDFLGSDVLQINPSRFD
jgi:YVTN family beta-propeller protein